MHEKGGTYMAVKLRLKRMGAKAKPFYRIVAADSSKGAQPTETVRNILSKQGIMKKFADSKAKKSVK